MDMIKGIKKRVVCFLLACSLSFGICAADYLEVQALEWAGTVIGLEEALKFLLGLIGVTVGVGVADTIDWQSMRENCVDFQIAQGQSAVAVSNWWADVIHGSLDTASDCWVSFKSWVSDIFNSSSSVGSTTVSNAILSVSPSANISSLSQSVLDFNFSKAVYYSYGNTIWFWFYDNNTSFVLRSSYYYHNPIIGDTFNFARVTLNGGNVSFSDVGSSGHGEVGIENPTYIYGYDGSLNSPYYVWDIPSSDVPFPNEGDLDSAFPNISDIAIAPSIATDLPYDGVIDLPWENVGANEEDVAEAIDGAQEKVISGEWSLSQYWEWVQNVTNVFAYDITNNYLLPNDGSNEPAEDKIQDNINRGAFVLAGLEKVFPFCIPWDIYAFVTLLVAEPVAPVIEYPIYNPVTKDEEVITIDFSVWEQQVIIMRYIMDFLLIIGLLLLARGLIGAGGSD